MTFFNRNQNAVLGIMVLPVTLALVHLVMLVMGILMERYFTKTVVPHVFTKYNIIVFHFV